MAKVKLISKHADEEGSQNDWFETLGVGNYGIEFNSTEREIFNYSFELYSKESYNDAYAGFHDLAQKGSSVCQYFLGLMCLRGCGALQDFILSHFWFNLAASRGHKKARSQLEKLTGSMSAEQVAEAQRMARDWVKTSRTDSDDAGESLI